MKPWVQSSALFKSSKVAYACNNKTLEVDNWKLKVIFPRFKDSLKHRRPDDDVKNEDDEDKEAKAPEGMFKKLIM